MDVIKIKFYEQIGFLNMLCLLDRVVVIFGVDFISYVDSMQY